MNKLQGNVIAKLCAWAVLLAAAFGAGIFGVRAVLSFGSVADDSWQNSSRYYNAVDERRRELVAGIRLSQRLEQLEQQIGEGTASSLAYADAEALREERAKVEDMIDSFTIAQAYANFLDEVSGSLEVGKEADMIVVDRNILACPSEDVGLAQVERTIFRGQTLYQK